MSNESIIKRMLEVCEKFESRQMSVLELGENISAHGTALENIDRNLEDFLIVFDGRCEEIEMDYLPKYQYEKGLNLIRELKEILASNYSK